jgi:uncharacterized protein YdeI (BOF family)
MKQKIQHFSSLLAVGVLCGMISWATSLSAQAPTQATPSQSTTQPNAGQAPNEPGQPQATPGQSTTPSQTPSSPSQAPNEPGQPSQTSPNSPSNSSATSGSTSGSTPSASDSQTLTGTIMKQGDKYVFQDAASGTTYDIDHQDEVKQYDGKKVKVHGTLDQATKTIHIQ